MTPIPHSENPGAAVETSSLTPVEKRAIDLYRAEEQRANALQEQVNTLSERLENQTQAQQKLLADLQRLRKRCDDLVQQLALTPVVHPPTRAPWERDL